ncbi:TIGR02679 family protein [Gordonia sp. TBRC 11910]|uniref:TIGR02679 family protein n=1 Tax=Gordonia asplenii TaxID=2725283 RepID=A0A848KU93_9ACTN|nr:TIGR02679 family protein [Gordonia asplenii]NMO01842.1 TIGR02679 family protein [Gordonia asplenii]
MQRNETSGIVGLFDRPEMAWFVDRVRKRILTAPDEPLSGLVRLADPTAEQRTAMADLIGRPRRAGDSLAVRLQDVEAVLRRGPWPAGLADLVTTVSGPVVDRRTQRKLDDARWAAATQALAPVVDRFPHIAQWWESWCAAGNLKRAAQSEARRRAVESTPAVGAQLTESIAALFDELPAEGVLLSVLARRVFGDAHGLDSTRPVGRLAIAVVACAFRAADDVGVRQTWASAGVMLSGLASTVLCLGVTGRSVGGFGTATATVLDAMGSARMPLVLTLDQVRSGGVAPLGSRGVVHVCENPSVVELVSEGWRGADASDCRPVLVCTSGQPSAAVIEVLTILTREGAQCRYHGDFDWAGLRIAAFVRSKVPWTPWRYGAEDYRAAVSGDAPSLRLFGEPAGAVWDPDLATAMAEHGLAVEEEAVAALLAADVLGA